MKKHQRSIRKEIPAKRIQFDDLITLEHTKCRHLSISIAENEDNRKLLGVEVSSMPAFGHLAKIAKQKNGYRKDERKQGIKSLLSKIQPAVDKEAKITTDEHQLYPKYI